MKKLPPLETPKGKPAIIRYHPRNVSIWFGLCDYFIAFTTCLPDLPVNIGLGPNRLAGSQIKHSW